MLFPRSILHRKIFKTQKLYQVYFLLKETFKLIAKKWLPHVKKKKLHIFPIFANLMIMTRKKKPRIYGNTPVFYIYTRNLQTNKTQWKRKQLFITKHYNVGNITIGKHLCTVTFLQQIHNTYYKYLHSRVPLSQLYIHTLLGLTRSLSISSTKQRWTSN